MYSTAVNIDFYRLSLDKLRVKSYENQVLKCCLSKPSINDTRIFIQTKHRQLVFTKPLLKNDLDNNQIKGPLGIDGMKIGVASFVKLPLQSREFFFFNYQGFGAARSQGI